MSNRSALRDITSARLHEDAEILASDLINRLISTRKDLGLTQAELAERVEIARMTVQRIEAKEGGVNLKTFLLLALALNLNPELNTVKTHALAPLAEDLVHRGKAYNRTQHDLSWRDRQREAALAEAWEKLNEYQPVGRTPVLSALLDNPTQQEATAAATVIQWLGSEIGFDFLTQALRSAGYEITAASSDSPAVSGTRKSFFKRAASR